MIRIQKLGPIFCLILIVFTTLISIIPSKAFAAADTPALDMERRILYHFSNCIDNNGASRTNVIDTGRDYKNANDPFGNQAGDQTVVVGRDLDDQGWGQSSQLGVMTCVEVMARGINYLFPGAINLNAPRLNAPSLNPQADALRNENTGTLEYAVSVWLVEWMSEQPGWEPGNDDTKVEEDTAGWTSRLQELSDMAEQRMNQIGAPTNQMMQRRFVQLLNFCYESSSAAPTGSEIPEGTFAVDLGGGEMGYFTPINNRQTIMGGHSGESNFERATFLHPGNQGGLLSNGDEDIFLGTTGGADQLKLGWHIGGNWISKITSAVVANAAIPIPGAGITAGFSDVGGTFNFTSDFYPMGNDITVPSASGIWRYDDAVVDCLFVQHADVFPVVFDGNVEVSDNQLVFKPGTTNADFSATSAPINAVNEADSCESRGGVMSWILCPVLNMMDATVSFLDSSINSLLYVKYDDYTRSNALELVWTRMRNLALLIIIPILLVMIISTMLGFSFVDAYTVKRALPRLLVAIVFITISWDLCRIMVEMTNAIGRGMAGIIASAVGGDAASLRLTDVFGGTEGAIFSYAVLGVGVGGTVAGVGLLTGASWIFIPLLIIVGTLVLAAAIALLILFLLLGFRQMLIMALIIVAPLAILSWIFPGNDKLWKSWWGMFSKLLLLFPVVIILITIGKVFAYVVAQSTSTGGSIFNPFVDFILKFSAYFLPYFLIPATFKWAGGVFANVTGMASNARKGLLGFGKGLRKRQYQKLGKEGSARLKGGKFFNKTDSEFFSKMNAKGQSLAHLKNIGDSGLKNWRADMRAGIQETEKTEQKHIMEDALFNVYAGFDDLSGMAADVIMGNKEGIRKRLMMKGIGVELDADGAVIKDAKGNMIVNNEAALSGEVSKIMDMQRSGNMRGALRQGLISAKAFGEGENLNEEALETNLSHVMRDLQKHGTQPFVQALVKKAGAGGTYYNDASDAWLAAGMSAGTDTAAEADMAATLRGILTNAGRADQGGGSFGKTIGFMRDLQAAETDEQRQGVLDKYMKHVIDNTPASTMFHQSMKTSYIDDNVISRIGERLEEAELAAAGKSQDSEEYQTYMRLLSDAENTHRMAQQTKPELAERMGRKILGRKLAQPITYEEEEPYLEPAPAGLLGPDGNPMPPTQKTRKVTRTIDTVRGATSYYGKRDGSYQNYNKQFYDAEDFRQQQAQQQAQQAQQQRQGPVTGPQPPVGGGPI